MATKRLTDIFVAKVQPPADKAQEDYFDTVLPAFGLRVGRRTKTYFVMVRALREGAWKLQRVTLGTVGQITLGQAREQAREAMQRAEAGQAPAEVRQERRAAQQAESANTYAAVVGDFLSKYRTRQKRKPAERTLAELKRVLTSGTFAAWADRPMAQITKRDIMDAADTLVEQGHETAANRYLTYLRMLFGWARKRGILTADPTLEVEKPGAESSRARVLSLDELRAIWHATAPTQANKGDLFANIVKVLILTGQRRNEVAGMAWSELDLNAGLWTLPEARAKNHREHLIPLAAPVLDILRERQAEQTAMGMKTSFVFTTAGDAPFSGWSRSKARLDARAGVADWTLHDLRRTLVTRMGEDLRIPPHIVEVLVNHVGTRAGVAGVYNRALYLDERQAALDAWAGYILRIVGEVETDNVVELRR